MKKPLSILVAVMLLLALAYSASAWYLGKQVEMAVSEPYKLIESVPYVKIVKREYRRGVFSSEETVTFELFGDMLRFIDQARNLSAAADPAAAKPSESLKPIQLTVRSRIWHGPLPDGKNFAVAIVDSELDADERFRPVVARVLGDRKLLTAHTVFRFGGDGESVVISPVFVATLHGTGMDAPAQVSWEGVRATIRFSKDLASYTIEGEAPKLEVKGASGVHIRVEGMRFETESKRIFEDEPLLHSGNQKFTAALAGIEGPAVGDKPILLRQIAYEVHIPVNGEFIDVVAKIGVQDALVGESNFGPAHYDFSLKRLHARTVAQMNRAMMKIYSDPAAQGAGAKPAAVMELLAKPAWKLLEYNPEISLDRISFKSPQGEVLITARARLNDAKAEHFKQPAIVIAKVDASADILLPEGLLMTPWGIKADSVAAAQTQMEMRQKQITALAEQGYIERDGAMIRSKLELRNGQFTVNGKPFNPAAMQAQAPKAGEPTMRPDAARRRLAPVR